MKRSVKGPRIEEPGVQLVQCPSQPGRLTISNKSCAERYNLAQEKDQRFPKDEFGIALMSGLKICKSCPEGRYFWHNRDWPHLSRRIPGGRDRAGAFGSEGCNEGAEDQSDEDYES